MLLSGIIVLYVLTFFYPYLFAIANLAIMILGALLLLDIMFVFGRADAIKAKRVTGDKFSNGDDNQIHLYISSLYPYPVFLNVIDEMPIQFQARNASYSIALLPGKEKKITYTLRPVKRGEYHFGFVNVYVASPIGLVRKRMKLGEEQMVPVYPSFLQMRKYEMLAISNRLTEVGVKKIRRKGMSREFDQIRDYVRGDDVRTINWKATARKASPMVNEYQEERSQQVYCIIDKGRTMKMPFEGMSLLDYAINASLVLSNTCLLKQDKPGIITFADQVSGFLKADRKGMQMRKVQEVLYNQKTKYLESSIEHVYTWVKTWITTRSLLVIFTNFESQAALHRQLPYLQMLAKNHLLIVVFFENTELAVLTEENVKSVEQVYIKTIAEKFAFEKKLIVKELGRYGIHSILTSPSQLTVNTLNKYLEIKSRGLI